MGITMTKPRKPLSTRLKIILFIGLILIIGALILGSRATIHGLIPVDAMRDPIPFRQSCEIDAQNDGSKEDQKDQTSINEKH